MPRPEWKHTGAFAAWVKKWRVGPGMNDGPRAARFLESLAGSKYYPQGELREKQELLAGGLYSGFDGTVGEGWIPLLDRLASDLVDMGWNRDLSQVKEKFGVLRFYIGGCDNWDALHERIVSAEVESGKTCENCGAPGRRRGPPKRSWLKTLCDTCEEGLE